MVMTAPTKLGGILTTLLYIYIFFIDTSSVPVNACAPSFDKKRFYIKGILLV